MNNTGATAAEAGGTIITSTMLSATDVDNTDSGLVYNVTGGLSNGFLALKAAKTTPITTFTQGDLNNGKVIYFHNGNETAIDSFDFTVSDGNLSDSGTFNVTVTPVNDASLAVDDITAFTTNEDTSINFDVLANDTDAENDTRTVTHVDGQAISVGGGSVSVANGSVVLNADKTLTFTPDADYNGPVSFEYSISDRPTARVLLVNPCIWNRLAILERSSSRSI